MTFLCRKAHFSAAHRLYNPNKSEEWNEETYGICGGEHWHGHNYKLEVTVAGTPDEETGYIIDLFVLKELIHERIIKKCDHKNLNIDVSFLEGIIPSTENLAEIFFTQLETSVSEAAADSGFLYSVKVIETERNEAVYCPYLTKL